MKTKYLKITLLSSIIGLIMMGTVSFATANVTMPKEKTTEAYQRWQALSDEEKKNYIEPKQYSLDIDESVRMSMYNKFTRGVGSSSIGNSYNLYNDIKFKIKDQKTTNECWAFATTTAIETNVAKTRNKAIELSPRHIDYATSKTFLDGINKKGYNREIGFGNFSISFGYCTSGKGPILENDMPFEDNENKVKLSAIDKKPVLKLENYVQFADIYKKYSADGTMKYTNGSTTEYTESQVLGVRNLIKEHIKKYGGVLGYTCLGGDFTQYLNIEKINQGESDTIAYYNSNSSTMVDHAITIVGWDDNYSKENFNENNKPKNDGAYLVLNSSPGKNGILSAMYISYEDVWIEYNNYGVVSTSDVNYDTLYQHDEYGYDVSLPLTNSATGENASIGYMANVFSRKATAKEEYLNEMSIYISSISNVDIYVNTENDDKTKIKKVVSAGILEPGYHTIKFATPLKLTGGKFVIAAKLTSSAVTIPTETNTLSNGLQSNFWDNAKSEANQSFISLDGKTWNDLNDMVKDSNICIKAFTTYQEKANVYVTNIKLNKTKQEMQEGESLTLIATISPSNATNKNVKWTSSNEKVATVTENGIITAIKEGTTTITVETEDGNKISTCEITVKGKTSKDDDIYYKDDKSKDTDTSIKDTTVATGSIPQTGVKITSIVFIMIAISTTIIVIYVRMRGMKDIK